MMLSVMPSVRYSSWRIGAGVDERQHGERLAAGRAAFRTGCAGGRRIPSAARAAPSPRPAPIRIGVSGPGRRSATRSSAAPRARADRRPTSSGSSSCSRLRDDFLRRAPANSRASGQHLVEHAAEREDVAAAVDALAGHLLRRHVAERAEHDALRRGGDRRAVPTTADRGAAARGRSRESSPRRRSSGRRSPA